ncbi:Indole-3-acetic acid-amido synthetase GH3.17 [Hibiscus syriacus]|uniref:Indole-3-acetic acid-amido synthetase GH3.17 n=1 Tax=Hibiscus syriacus TaxID=106335 RepID=A0A6A2WYA7_HIBSY|nr:Indole-3-acetic acid-amido synthetase GH3.17 [Hibiscus syriacus]
MATNDYESGLKMLEELTTNARQIQDQLLGEILTKNAGTEYLSRFLHGQNDKRLFRKNVPVVAYEDLKPYIDRIANGEASSDILLAEPLTGFSLRHVFLCFRLFGVFSILFFYFFYEFIICLIKCSSGTSGGQPKLIPVIDETTNTHTMYNNIFRSVMIKHFGDINQAGKRMELMFVKPDVETPSGLKATAVSSRFFKRSGFRAILPKLYTSPFETIVCPDAKQSMYCQILFGLIQRDEVVMIGSVFASGVLRGFKFLENNWQELCSNIRTGRISDWITDSGCKNAASSILKANSELADLIENICMKSWEGIIRKLWPKTKYIGTICTGAMMQYTAELEFYCGGLPLVSGFYGCSEGAVGINLEPRSKPLDVSYTFLPNSVYFEFVPIKEECVANSPNLVESVETKSSDEDTEPVELVNVKPGQCYELLVTNSTGKLLNHEPNLIKCQN